MVQLAAQGKNELAAFEEQVKDWPAVRECWMLSGDVDFILKCVAPNLSAFQDLVSELTAPAERPQRPHRAHPRPRQGRAAGADRGAAAGSQPPSDLPA